MPRSLAMTSAILFSNPSIFWLENGRFSGSAHTRNCFWPAPKAHDATSSIAAAIVCVRDIITSSLRKREDRQHAALVAEAGDVAERAERAEPRGRIVRADVRGDANPRPSADTGQHRDVLLAVGPDVGHRIADDAGRCLELPQQITGLRIHRLQPSLHRPVEDDVAGGGERAGPVRQLFLHAPDFLVRGRIPGDELATIAARPRVAHDDRADVRLASLVLYLHAFVVHAQVVRRNVDEIRPRRVRDRLLVLAAHRRRTDVFGVSRGRRLLFGILDRLAGLQVHARRPVDDDEWVGHEKFTGRAVEHVREAVAIEIGQNLSRLSLDVDVEQHHLVDAVVVPPIVRSLLVRPLRPTGVGVACEDRHRPLVVAGPLIGIPRSVVAGAVVEEVQLRVVALPSPRRPPAALPLVALPRVFRAWAPDFGFGPGAVHPPDLLAGVDVVRGDESADAELAAADARDHLVLDHHRRRRDRLPDLVVALLRLPEFLAGFSVESDSRRVELILEDLAVGIGETG